MASSNGHTDIARMLAGEYNAIVDIQSAVRTIVTLPLCAVTARMVVVFVVAAVVVVAVGIVVVVANIGTFM